MMMTEGLLTVRPAKLVDLPYIAEHMRQADRDEIFSSHRFQPLAALEYGCRYSQMCLVAIHDSAPCAIFGLAKVSDTEGCVWMLGTPYLDSIKVTFVKTAKLVIKVFLEAYPVLSNHVDMRNQKSIALLLRLGAQFEPPKPYGVDAQLFTRFTFRRG